MAVWCPLNQVCGFAGCGQPQAIAITSRKPTAPGVRVQRLARRNREL
jgi:hypothetical protein